MPVQLSSQKEATRLGTFRLPDASQDKYNSPMFQSCAIAKFLVHKGPKHLDPAHCELRMTAICDISCASLG